MSEHYGAAKPRRVRRTSSTPGGRLSFQQEEDKRRREEEEWAALCGPVTIRYKDKAC